MRTVECSRCHGAGEIGALRRPPDPQTYESGTCPVCHGEGVVGIFMDGTGITPGTGGCKCGPECEHPCFLRVGTAPACTRCGCPPFPDEDGPLDVHQGDEEAA